MCPKREKKQKKIRKTKQIKKTKCPKIYIIQMNAKHYKKKQQKYKKIGVWQFCKKIKILKKQKKCDFAASQPPPFLCAPSAFTTAVYYPKGALPGDVVCFRLAPRVRAPRKFIRKLPFSPGPNFLWHFLSKLILYLHYFLRQTCHYLFRMWNSNLHILKRMCEIPL